MNHWAIHSHLQNTPATCSTQVQRLHMSPHTAECIHIALLLLSPVPLLRLPIQPIVILSSPGTSRQCTGPGRYSIGTGGSGLLSPQRKDEAENGVTAASLLPLCSPELQLLMSGDCDVTAPPRLQHPQQHPAAAALL